MHKFIAVTDAQEKQSDGSQRGRELARRRAARRGQQTVGDGRQVFRRRVPAPAQGRHTREAIGVPAQLQVVVPARGQRVRERGHQHSVNRFRGRRRRRADEAHQSGQRRVRFSGVRAVEGRGLPADDGPGGRRTGGQGDGGRARQPQEQQRLRTRAHRYRRVHVRRMSKVPVHRVPANVRVSAAGDRVQHENRVRPVVVAVVVAVRDQDHAVHRRPRAVHPRAPRGRSVCGCCGGRGREQDTPERPERSSAAAAVANSDETVRVLPLRATARGVRTPRVHVPRVRPEQREMRGKLLR